MHSLTQACRSPRDRRSLALGENTVTRRQDWLDWLIIQNTNAYEIGFTSAWDGFLARYGKNRTPETEKPLAAFLEVE